MDLYTIMDQDNMQQCECIFCEVARELGFEGENMFMLCEGMDPTCDECVTWREHYDAMKEDHTYAEFRLGVMAEVQAYFDKRGVKAVKAVIPEKARPARSPFDPTPVYDCQTAVNTSWSATTLGTFGVMPQDEADTVLSNALLEQHVQDTIEAHKMEQELKQALKDRPDGQSATPSPRTKSIQWRLSMLYAWALVAGVSLFPGANAELSQPEQYANAFYTITWSLVVFMVFYSLSKVLLLLGTTVSQVLLTSCAAFVAMMNAGTALINTVSGSVPGLMNDVSTYMRWMRITHAVSAGAQVLTAILPIIKAPFLLLGFLLTPSELKKDFPLRSEGKLQQANKYGVLLSAVLAAVMFIMVPVWGFAKSYKYWEPVRRLLEQLPYVTWLMEWLSGLAEGTATVDDIPTSVRAFANGEEVPMGKNPVFGEAGVCPKCKNYLCRCSEDEPEVDEQELDDMVGEKELPLKQEGRDDKQNQTGFGNVLQPNAMKWKHEGATPENLRALTPEEVEANKLRMRKLMESAKKWKAGHAVEYESAGVQPQFVRPPGLSYPLKNQGREDDEEDPFEARIRLLEEASAREVLADGEPTWWELIKECGELAIEKVKYEFSKPIVQTAVGAALTTLVLGGIAVAIALSSGTNPGDYIPEGNNKGKGNKPKVRWAPAPRVKHYTPPKKLEHPDSPGNVDNHLDTEPIPRRNAAMDEYEKRFESDEEYYSEGAIAKKSQELGMKWFPARVDPAQVAQRKRAIRKAQTKRKSYTLEELQKLREGRKDFLVHEESMLGQQRFVYNNLAVNCVKVVHGEEETSSGTLIPGRVIVPLHSHIEGKEVSVYNHALSAKLRGEVVPLVDDNGEDLDLGFHHSYGAFAAKAVKIRPPKNERVIQIGFTPKDEVEPSFGIGFCSADGLYDAPTDFMVCGGGVYAVEDGALVGIHIGGGEHCNRFIPMTEKLVAQLTVGAPALRPSLFH